MKFCKMCVSKILGTRVETKCPSHHNLTTRIRKLPIARMHPGARFPNRAFLCLVSGCYIVQKNGAFPPQPILIEHCCLMTEGNSWDISVKCRPHSNQCEREKNWQNVMEVYPNAKVERKHNDIELTLPVLTENLEVAAFGVPKENDQKRMQMTIFGKDPTQGCNWKIRVYLIDDSKKAFKVICEKEAEKGNRLLTTIAGLFVSNSKENIRIEFTDLDPGWQMKGGNVKIIDMGDAWNSPENSANFPLCIFEVSHVDQTKQQFFCRIIVSHDDDSANTEMVAFFEKKRGVGIKPPRKRKNAPMKPLHAETHFSLLGPRTKSRLQR